MHEAFVELHRCFLEVPVCSFVSFLKGCLLFAWWFVLGALELLRVGSVCFSWCDFYRLLSHTSGGALHRTRSAKPARVEVGLWCSPWSERGGGRCAWEKNSSFFGEVPHFSKFHSDHADGNFESWTFSKKDQLEAYLASQDEVEATRVVDLGITKQRYHEGWFEGRFTA